MIFIYVYPIYVLYVCMYLSIYVSILMSSTKSMDKHNRIQREINLPPLSNCEKELWEKETFDKEKGHEN